MSFCLRIRILKLNKLFHSVRHQNICRKNITTKLFIAGPVIPLVYAQAVSIEDKNKPNYVIEGNQSSIYPDPQSEEKTGWERLRAVFTVDEYGNLSVQMTASIQGMSLACLAGFIYGGVIHSREAFTDFMDRNQASIFENHLDAKRKLQNHVTIHFAKGAFRWSWRLSLFTGTFMLMILSLSAYRGETAVTNYMASGTVVGALLRLRLGHRGMIVGGTLGLMLGTFCGLMTTGLLALSGQTLDDVLAFQQQLDKSKMDLFNEYKKKDTEARHLGQESVALLQLRETDSDKKPPV